MFKMTNDVTHVPKKGEKGNNRDFKRFKSGFHMSVKRTAVRDRVIRAVLSVIMIKKNHT